MHCRTSNDVAPAVPKRRGHRKADKEEVLAWRGTVALGHTVDFMEAGGVVRLFICGILSFSCCC